MSILNYGLTADDLDYTINKVNRQRDFLKSQQFITQNGQSKTLLDVSYSANHSERYYSQVLNKIHTMNSYALAYNLDPIFMTATLDAPFHEMIQGKFDKFYKKYQIVDREIYSLDTGEKITGLVPNNDRYGYLLDDIRDRKQLKVKDIYKILSYQMHGFLKSYVFKKMKKEESEYIYVRVTEPMKSGVPHYHLLMYIDPAYRKELYDSFHKYFSAPQNAKHLTMRQNKRLSEALEDGTRETQGFQWLIRSATSYVLKYVLKSFRNVRDNEEIDYLQAWYINHRIPRVITSQTLVPQWVYKKVAMLDNDWFYLTDIKRNGYFECNSQENTFNMVDFSGRNIKYDNGLLQVFYGDKLIKEMGTKKEPRIAIKPMKLKWITKEEYEPLVNRLIPVYYEKIGLTLYMTQGSTKPKPLYQHKTISKMKIYDLWNYRNEFDFDNENILKFFNIENELIRRGALEQELHDLNSYSDFSREFDNLCAEDLF